MQMGRSVDISTLRPIADTDLSRVSLRFDCRGEVCSR